MQLLKKYERGCLQDAVSRMRAFGLKYVMDRTPHGTIEYRLDPYVYLFKRWLITCCRALDLLLAQFLPATQKRAISGPSIVKQMIASEVALIIFKLEIFYVRRLRERL